MQPHKFFRKEIKGPDEFFTITGRVLHFIKKEQKKISWVVTILAVIIAFIVFWPRYQAGKTEEAATLFYYATKLFDADVVEKKAQETPVEGEGKKEPEAFTSEKEKFEKIRADLQKIETDFPRTPSAYYSKLYIGHSYFHLSEYDKAIETYRAFLKDTDNDSEFYLIALYSLALSFEKKGEFEPALEEYKKILNAKGDFLKDTANYSIARTYEKMNKPEEAKKYYSVVQKAFESSPFNELAKKHLLMLPTTIAHE